MDPLSSISLIGLAGALVAALVVLRRRGDEAEALRAALELARREPATGAPHGDATSGHDPVLELLPVGVLGLDAGGRVVRANARAHALLDAAPGRLVGRSTMETFLDARVEAQLAALPRGGTMSAELRAGGVAQRPILLRATRLADGSPLPVHVVLEDVSELRRLQQIRTEFIDNLSHELRTPLSTVSLLAETLARDAERADVPPPMKERIAKVEVETGHLVQMVSELLDLARIEGGTRLSMEDDVDLGRLAEASAERLRLFAERQGVGLVVEVEPGTPMIRGDEARLGQVFVNLVHNAVKFSPDGGEVRIRVGRDDDDVMASVRDHGIGIAAGDRARVFERFYKVDRARVRGGGTGLGLSIARHVVEGHGGRIWVESEEGAGSTFAFAIPVPPVQAARPGPVPSSAVQPS